MPTVDSMTHQKTPNSLTNLNVELYWDSKKARVLFRGIAGVGRKYEGVTRQAIEKGWPILIEALGLETKEDADRARKEIRRRLKPR